MADPFDPGTFSPHDPAFLANPYPTYTAFRDQAPIYPVALYGSDWMFRYADCVQVLTDEEMWIKNRPDGTPPPLGPYGTMASNFPLSLFASDPELHTQLRSILEPLFKDAIQDAEQLARFTRADELRQTGSPPRPSRHQLPPTWDRWYQRDPVGIQGFTT